MGNGGAGNGRGVTLDENTGRVIPRCSGPYAGAEKVRKTCRLPGGMPGRLEEGGPGGCALLAHRPPPLAQVEPLPSRPLTLPTLFRNRVPETGRAAGREARSVPASFPFESPCGISFHTVRKSERETLGWSAAPGRLPHSAGGRQLPGAGRPSLGAGRGGRAPTPTELGVEIAVSSGYQAPC